MWFKIRDISAVKQNFSAGGTMLTTDQIKQCGFTGTIGTYQTHDLSFADGKIDIAKSAAIVKSFTQRFQL
jgi:hypothetical protein